MALGPQPLFTAKTADPAAPPTGEGVVVGDMFAAIFAATAPAQPNADDAPAAPESEEDAIEPHPKAGEGDVSGNPLLTLAAILLPNDPAKAAVVAKPDVAVPQPSVTATTIAPTIPVAPATIAVASGSDVEPRPRTEAEAKPVAAVAARTPMPQVMLPAIDSIAREPQTASTSPVAPRVMLPSGDLIAEGATAIAAALRTGQQPMAVVLPVEEAPVPSLIAGKAAPAASDAPTPKTSATPAAYVQPAPTNLAQASASPPTVVPPTPEATASPAPPPADGSESVAPRDAVVTLLRCEIPGLKPGSAMQDVKAQTVAAPVPRTPAATVVQAAGLPQQQPNAPAPAAKERLSRLVQAPIESMRAKVADLTAAILPQAAPAADSLPFAVTATPQAAPAAAQPLAAPMPVAEALIAQKLDMAHEGEWLDQLARDIAGAGGKDGLMRFRLNPENLGSLQVEVKHSANGAAVRMTTDTDAARAIIVDAQPRLVAEARAQGVRISETHVDVGQHGQHAQSGFGDSRRREDVEQQTVLRAARGKKSVTTSTLTMSGRAADRYA